MAASDPIGGQKFWFNGVPFSGARNVKSEYNGPGNVLGTARVFWGLRAYNASSIGTNCVRLVRASDSTQQDFVTLSSGMVDIASINTFLASTTGKVVTLYDQTGNGFNLTQATDARRAVWTANSGNPYVLFDENQNHFYQSAGTDTQAQPFSLAYAAQCVRVGTNQRTLLCTAVSFAAGFCSNGTGDLGMMYAGSTVSATATENAWHSRNDVFNGASSHLYVDGTNTTVNAGAGGVGGAYTLGQIASSQWFNGQFREIGVWLAAHNGTNATNYKNNASAFWGY